MAKRVRGGTTRPGQRAPLQRSGTRPAASSSSASPSTAAAPSRPPTLTDEEAARAAELEAQILAEEKAAEDAAKRGRDRGRRSSTPAEPVVRGTIATRASLEYAYVARDLRRVTIIGGGLVAFLIGLWAVVEITGIGPF
jgi:hypothetical protein